MAAIIRGTTPTIQYNFNSVQVSNIAVAYLTIKQGGTIVVEKDIATATTGEKSLSWTLTQEETLTIAAGQAEAMLNWRLQDGTRGASVKNIVAINSNHIEEVI